MRPYTSECKGVRCEGKGNMFYDSDKGDTSIKHIQYIIIEVILHVMMVGICPLNNCHHTTSTWKCTQDQFICQIFLTTKKILSWRLYFPENLGCSILENCLKSRPKQTQLPVPLEVKLKSTSVAVSTLNLNQWNECVLKTQISDFFLNPYQCNVLINL